MKRLGVFIFLMGGGRRPRVCVLLLAFFLTIPRRWIHEVMQEMNALGNAVERSRAQGCIVGITV